MLQRNQVAARHAEVKRIIDATEGAPVIVNPESKFVVVTYWWGRGNLNRNTARPCVSFYEDMYKYPINLLLDFKGDVSQFCKFLDEDKNYKTFLLKKGKDYIGESMSHYKTLRGGARNDEEPPLNLAQLEHRAIRIGLGRNQPEPESPPLNLEQIEKRAIARPSFTDPNEFVSILKETLCSALENHTTREVLDPILMQYRQTISRKNEIDEEVKRALLIHNYDAVNILKSELEALKSEKVRHASEIKRIIANKTYSILDRKLRYKNPILFEDMIGNWENACRENNSNFMAIEYPEFAQPGGYQLAINAKPRFIQKALELCAPRGVLYIDGDMKITKYPAIFDIEDVDMMARGWNIDPRSSYKHRTSITVDPYNFETSGGTMFFGSTPEARTLLERWIEVSEMPSQWGKADDRILSLIFNTKKMLLPMKIIQLPVEYLWLTLDYDDTISHENMDRDSIYIEHPECLTSEDTAGGAGASSDRSPKFYAGIENQYPRSEALFEYTMFPNEKMRDTFKPYLDYIGKVKYFDDKIDDCVYGMHPFNVVPFSDMFGKDNNKIMRLNEEHVRTLQVQRTTVPPVKPVTGFENIPGYDTIHIVTDTKSAIPDILYGLKKGQSVLFVPPTSSPRHIQSMHNFLTNERFHRIEFAFFNTSNDIRDVFFFQSQIDYTQPILFRPTSIQLQHLILISKNLHAIGKMFKSGYQFLSRIRTHYLLPSKIGRQTGGGIDTTNEISANIAEKSTDALNFLYGNSKQAGGKRVRRQTIRRYKQHRKYKTRKH